MKTFFDYKDRVTDKTLVGNYGFTTVAYSMVGLLVSGDKQVNITPKELEYFLLYYDKELPEDFQIYDDVVESLIVPGNWIDDNNKYVNRRFKFRGITFFIKENEQ